MNIDILDIGYINSLPQPFVGIELDGSEWDVVDLEVVTGWVRIDVMGAFQIVDIAQFRSFRDGECVERSASAFFIDATPEDRTPIKEQQ